MKWKWQLPVLHVPTQTTTTAATKIAAKFELDPCVQCGRDVTDESRVCAVHSYSQVVGSANPTSQSSEEREKRAHSGSHYLRVWFPKAVSCYSYWLRPLLRDRRSVTQRQGGSKAATKTYLNFILWSYYAKCFVFSSFGTFLGKSESTGLSIFPDCCWVFALAHFSAQAVR